MSTTWKDLIERLLTEEIGMDHPDVVEAARDPRFVQQLDEMLEISSALDEERMLAELSEESPAVGSIDTRALFQAELGRPLPRAWSWSKSLAVLAAAALVVFIARPIFQASPIPTTPAMLGGAGLECLAPVGSGADFSEFLWTNAGKGGSYRLEFFDRHGEPIPALSTGELGDVLRWVPREEDLSAMNAVAGWGVWWRPPGGGPEAHDEEAASPAP